MIGFPVRRFLPNAVRASLWGDRSRWGLAIREEDPCWREWVLTYSEFYLANQRGSIGARVNDAGYRVMSSISLRGKRVLEIGAGDIRHTAYWRDAPAEYFLADVSNEMMAIARNKLREIRVPHDCFLVGRGQALPMADNSLDVVVSFYSLEHLYPLSPYLEEIKRVLRPGGILVGAIPAEGGLAWGIGRFLTSRRWFKKYTSINPDKIICWEHPNFADHIVRELDVVFKRQAISLWPLPFLPALDFNLVFRFRYQKPCE